MPPSHAGIEPSALPAFTAPSGVNSVPNLAASASETLATALEAPKAIMTAADNIARFFIIIVLVI